MTIPATDAAAVVAALTLALVLTPLVRGLARRLGAVARPKGDRWHRRPTALFGGVAIFAAVAVVSLTLVPLTAQMAVVLGSSAVLFLLGLVDDLFPLKPYQKLVGQFMGAMPVLACGMTLPWTGSPLVDTAVTIVWLVGITNAVNLLDNMDGLAAGVALIASAFLAAHAVVVGDHASALVMAVFAAALLGFLVYNWNPASIFMGDCGSLFIGFFLAGSALAHPSSGRSRSFLPVLAVPVLTLLIPIFDTVLVTVLRKLAGRAASQGGRDHTSHRLVALGLSERRAVGMLYGFAVIAGLLGLLVRNAALDVSLAVIAGFTLVLALLGIHLAGVKVYEEADLEAGQRPLLTFFADRSYKRRVFEVMLDVVLIVLSYYTAHALVFGPITGEAGRDVFLRTVPVLVFVKTAVFLVSGVYRGVWRYVGIDSLVTITKAVAVGTALGALLVFDSGGYSRLVLVLDALLLLCGVAGTRIAFRLFRSLFSPPGARDGRRVLIYGAGDAGELLARELANNHALGCLPVGFLDDDPLKKGKVIHGLRVLGGNGSFLSICERERAEEVLLASRHFPASRVEDVRRQCARAGIVLRQARIEMSVLHQPSPPDTPPPSRGGFDPVPGLGAAAV